MNGTFEQFIEGILSANLTFERLHARYHSPSQGELDFGWQGDLLQNGVVVKLDGYPRYENPFVKAAFGVEEVEWERGEAPGSEGRGRSKAPHEAARKEGIFAKF